MKQFLKDISTLKKAIKNKYVIGVIGHRDLLKEDYIYSPNGDSFFGKEIKKALSNKIEEIMGSVKNKEVVLLSSLAEGADRIVSEIAYQDFKIEIIHVAPWFDEEKEELNQKFDIRVELDFCDICTQSNDNEKKNEMYDLVAKFILINSDAILFLWDGVLTGNRGGTSHSYHQALFGIDNNKSFSQKYYLRSRTNKKNRTIIYHLSTPRRSNPFPAGKRYNNERKTDVSFSDYSRVFPYQWHIISEKHPLKKYKSIRRKRISLKSFIMNKFFWAYFIPFLFIFLMALFWLLGVDKAVLSGDDLLMVIKLPSADLPGPEVLKIVEKKIAVWLGVLLIPYSVIITMYFALANDRKIISTKIQTFFGRPYKLVLGLGWKGLEITENLKNYAKTRTKVVVVDKDENNPHIQMVSSKGIRVISGNFNDESILNKINWKKATDIYLLAKDDVTNIRTIQLMDAALRREKSEREITIHTHLDDFKNKFFVSTAQQDDIRLKLNCFNVYENSIRRILLKHPLDRFYNNTLRTKIGIEKADSIKIVILGYNEVAQALFRYCLTHCFYRKNISVNIEIYKENTEDILKIKNDIPETFESILNKKGKKHTLPLTFKPSEKSEIGKYVYSGFSISVYDLPETDFDIFHNSAFIKEIKSREITSIFACIDDGLRSSAYLSSILPILEIRKEKLTADIQVYCYFNFPEEKENTFIEESINNIASHIPVFFFGNFTEELTESAIKEQELDKMAKIINAFYDVAPDYKIIRNERDNFELIAKKIFDRLDKDEWRKLPELKKESNKLAADHMFVKIRSALEDIGYLEKEPYKLYYDVVRNSVSKFDKEKGMLCELSNMEHRRWCAERLFFGWRPIVNNETNLKKWKKHRKKIYEPQRLHLDLKDFQKLNQIEKGKDLVISENIDLMFELL